jgi:hypothetical protein
MLIFFWVWGKVPLGVLGSGIIDHPIKRNRFNPIVKVLSQERLISKIIPIPKLTDLF